MISPGAKLAQILINYIIFKGTSSDLVHIFHNVTFLTLEAKQ